jgi:polyhydroxyalkanoate synthase
MLMDTPYFDPARLMASLFGGGNASPERPQAARGRGDAQHAGTSSGASEASPASTTANLAAVATQMAHFQHELARQMMSLWPMFPPAWQAEAAKKAEADKRFAGEAWRTDPRFDLLRKSYLGYAEFLQNSVEQIPADDKTKAQMRYGMRQFIDAMSPANFFMTNPEAIQLAAETGGQSVMNGMSLFFEDLAKGRISTTDEESFEVGRNIATMPGQVIYENELAQLIQYEAATDQVYERPIVMIPPCINKFYIMDLQPDNSLVRYLREQGHTVFMLSWRNVGADLGHLRWDDYLEMGVMRAINVAREIARVEQVNALGFCIGGSLLASGLAVMKARDEDPVSSMTLLTAMLDFRDSGEIGALVTEDSVKAREQAIGNGGIMEGKELSFTFSSLRSNDLIWQYVSNSYLKGKAPPAFDMLYWNADQTNLPGPMFCWYVRNCYLENNLRVPDKTTLCDVPVDLTIVDVPAFLYASREDHIVPWRTAYASTELLAGDVTFVLGASGHIAGVINPPAKNKRNYWVGGAAVPDPVRWFETATDVPGSWWPEWGRWLARHAGDRVAAPVKLGSRKHKPIEPAPGRYVRERA